MGGVHLYGDVNWSTEPWIITLGSNVHITGGTKFITHDGGTLLYRNQIPDLEITNQLLWGMTFTLETMLLFSWRNYRQQCGHWCWSVVSKDIG